MCGRENKDANMQQCNVKCTFSILVNDSWMRFLTITLFPQVSKVTFDVRRQTALCSADVFKEVCSTMLIDEGHFWNKLHFCNYFQTVLSKWGKLVLRGAEHGTFWKRYIQLLFVLCCYHQAAFEGSWIWHKHLLQKVIQICEEGFMFLTVLKPRCWISHIHSFSFVLFCSNIR